MLESNREVCAIVTARPKLISQVNLMQTDVLISCTWYIQLHWIKKVFFISSLNPAPSVLPDGVDLLLLFHECLFHSIPCLALWACVSLCVCLNCHVSRLRLERWLNHKTHVKKRKICLTTPKHLMWVLAGEWWHSDYFLRASDIVILSDLCLLSFRTHLIPYSCLLANVSIMCLNCSGH